MKLSTKLIKTMMVQNISNINPQHRKYFITIITHIKPLMTFSNSKYFSSLVKLKISYHRPVIDTLSHLKISENIMAHVNQGIRCHQETQQRLILSHRLALSYTPILYTVNVYFYDVVVYSIQGSLSPFRSSIKIRKTARRNACQLTKLPKIHTN